MAVQCVWTCLLPDKEAVDAVDSEAAEADSAVDVAEIAVASAAVEASVVDVAATVVAAASAVVAASAVDAVGSRTLLRRAPFKHIKERRPHSELSEHT